MFRSVATWLAVAILSGLAGCASTSTSLSPTTLAQTKTVGLAYALPDELDFVICGITAFDNHIETPDIADWQLASTFTDAAATALRPTFQIVTAPIHRVDIGAISRNDDQPSAADIKAALGPYAPHADLWVLLEPACYIPEMQGGHVAACGIGIYRRRRQLVRGNPVFGAFAVLDVYDGTSFALLASADLVRHDDACALIEAGHVPFGAALNPLGPGRSPSDDCLTAQRLDDDWVIDGWRQSAMYQRAALAPLLRPLLAQATADTLHTLKLTN